MTTHCSGILVLGLVFGLGAASFGCGRAKTPPAAAAAPALAPERARPAPVARVIFVGKEHACDCTRKAVEAGWAALQKAVGPSSKLPVERYQVDTTADKVAPYSTQKPIMALPAIYFVDSKGAVLGQLQGEVTAEQIVSALRAQGAGS